MAERRYETTLTRAFAAPRALVWALVADTNRWDRASGLSAGRYAWREVDGTRVRTASARELGFALEWIEPPYRWIEGRFVHGERTFLSGPVERGGFEARLSDAEDGTVVKATAYVVGAGALMPIVGPIQKARFRGALRRYFDAIADVVARDADELGGDEPAVNRARRALMGGYDAVASGDRSDANERELEVRAQRLETQPVPAALGRRIVDFLRDRPDEEVAQMRPFELARAWSLDKREVLRAFLYATRAGLTDLRWQVNCPVCRVSANVVESLENVENAVHCEACNIEYGVDFSRHVEAVFTVNRAVREVYPAVYCASSPAFLPHVYAQLRLAPGASITEDADLFTGELHVRSLRDTRTADCELDDGRSTVRLDFGHDSVDASVTASPRDEGEIAVDNRSDDEVVVLLERAGWAADSVFGSVIASFPEFLDLFATEAPASGVELAVGEMSILFTDLTGSTAMYERIGDARAFAIVEHHFKVCDRVVREHDGAIVKTMGDAVMAAFASPVRAVEAAFALEAANRDDFREHALSMRVGVHAGPCLAVRANDRLDFFGTTVNVAARLEHQATPGHLVVAEGLFEHPTIQPLLDGRPNETFDAELKGIQEIQRLVRVRLASME
jgi:class 3 adenylate cyclase